MSRRVELRAERNIRILSKNPQNKKNKTQYARSTTTSTKSTSTAMAKKKFIIYLLYVLVHFSCFDIIIGICIRMVVCRNYRLSSRKNIWGTRLHHHTSSISHHPHEPLIPFQFNPIRMFCARACICVCVLYLRASGCFIWEHSSR